VVEVLGGLGEVDLDPVDLAGELVAARPVVLRHHGAARTEEHGRQSRLRQDVERGTDGGETGG
jgi:hypothetical protein